MTFYEAALRVLESAGHPLHFQEITEQSIAQNLLSHVGKAPDKTMLSRLAAMARRTRDRRVLVTARDTFALAEWSIPEDPEALAQTGVPELNPEESLPPLRSPERHPEARAENVRAAGRSDRRRKYEEEEDLRSRRRRFPPISELVFEILSAGDKPMKPEDIAQIARERELAGAELAADQILTALLEDNQRRIDVGRRPQFVFSKDTGELNLERAGAGERSPLEVQAAFAEALRIPLENGRPVSAKAPAVTGGETVESVNAGVKAAAKDARRTVARELRRRLAELDVEAFHKALVKVLQSLGFRELKVAKRSRDGLLLTARKREGSVDLRFAVRLLKGTAPVDRRMVQDLRRDLSHYSAQVGLIASTGELRGDARAEAQSHGALAMVWCGDALGDKFVEARAGVTPVHLEVFEVDEGFFAAAKLEAEEARRRRDERIRERQARDGRKASEEADILPASVEPSPAGEQSSSAVPGEPASVGPAALESSEDASQSEAADEPGDDEADELKPVAGNVVSGAAQPGERKRRRRRRRGRRGRSRPPETGAPTPTPAGAQEPAAPATEAPAASVPAPARTENESQ
jgi:hypothetical protein